MDNLNLRSILVIILAVAAVVLFLLILFQRKRRRSPVRTPYIDALYALIENRKDDALRLLTQAVKNGETDIDAYIQLGNLLREKKMPEKALQIHRNLTVRRDLGYDEEKSIQIAIAEDLADMGKMDRALAALNTINKRKKDSDVIYTLHRLYHRCGDYDNAFNMLKSLASFDKTIGTPEKAAYLSSVASILLSGGDRVNAGRYLKRAAKEDSRSVPVLYLTGRLYMELADYNHAADSWKALLLEDISFFPEIFPVLEKALFEAGRFENLEAVLEELNDRHQIDPLVSVALASLYVKKGAIARSIDILEEEKNFNRKEPAISLKLASVYLEAGREMDARRVLDEADLVSSSGSRWSCRSCGHQAVHPLRYCTNCSAFNSIYQVK